MVIIKIETFPLRISFRPGNRSAAAAWADKDLLVRANVRQAIDAGFGTLKLHEIELPAIRAAHEEAGPGIELTLDVNCSWTLNEASHFYDDPDLLAAIHATAALGTADSMIEWRWFDLEAQIYGGALKPERGRISVPRGPGLGIDTDPDVVRTYTRK
jgi:L-alanine-DL-glutamate epimerase-like enolase superfamily enzyme